LDQIRVPMANSDGLRLESQPDANGMWTIMDGNGKPVALLARTLPAAADAVGYRGPTESAMVLDRQLKIVSVTLLSSADTREHVAAVVADDDFFRQFEGWPWGGPPAEARVDAVSGATLTSLALAQGVLQRIGGARPSLVFPQPLAVAEIRDWFPGAIEIDDVSGDVRGPGDELLGRVIRSGPLADDALGYQGPSEVLLQLSPADQVEAIRLRSSFDNEPYVDYVRVEAGFWKTFTGKSLGELARFSPKEAGVEGVSGATMTSLAVADCIVATARAEMARRAAQPATPPPWWRSLRWTRSEVATAAMLVLAAIFSRWGWFRIRAVRRLWLLSVLLIVGCWAGNLVSLALVAGWSAEGVAWQLAPGLTALVVASLLFPPLTRHNPYCSHLCPHGAVQQLIKPGRDSRRRLTLSRSTLRILAWIPGATLVAAYVALIVMPATDLSSWEPFHAYLFRIAGWGSILLAILSLAVAAVIPLGYCRLGCPTGRLLDYLRRTAVSDRVQGSDLLAIGLLAVALWLRLRT
jgi:hypothetical protein